MAERTCFNCVYSSCDPLLWLRWLWMGESIVPQCANHPRWPGQLHDVPGVPCRNYRPKPVPPQGDNVRMIPLTDGCYAYVDAADYEWLNQWQWYLVGGYAARFEKGRTIFMHRQIMQPPNGLLVDHADGNKVNNCRCNLRVCTRAQNSRNKRKHSRSASVFKGVLYNRKTRKWYARCRDKGRGDLLGPFDTEVEAARAYDHAAIEQFGEFARLNLPREWPPERRAQVYAQRQETEEQGQSDKEEGTSKKGKERGKRVSSRAGTPGRRERKPKTRRSPQRARRTRGPQRK